LTRASPTLYRAWAVGRAVLDLIWQTTWGRYNNSSRKPPTATSISLTRRRRPAAAPTFVPYRAAGSRTWDGAICMQVFASASVVADRASRLGRPRPKLRLPTGQGTQSDPVGRRPCVSDRRQRPEFGSARPCRGSPSGNYPRQVEHTTLTSTARPVLPPMRLRWPNSGIIPPPTDSPGPLYRSLALTPESPANRAGGPHVCDDTISPARSCRHCHLDQQRHAIPAAPPYFLRDSSSRSEWPASGSSLDARATQHGLVTARIASGRSWTLGSPARRSCLDRADGGTPAVHHGSFGRSRKLTSGRRQRSAVPFVMGPGPRSKASPAPLAVSPPDTFSEPTMSRPSPSL